MSSTYAKFVADPSSDASCEETFNKNVEALSAHERREGDLEQLSKSELKSLLLMHMAAGSAFAFRLDEVRRRKNFLESENASLRQAGARNREELGALREIFGYD
jgi:hypothetical protein